MLYGSESISYYSTSNIIVWMTMAFQAGLLNMGGFLTCHRFISHVTGFATFFGFELSQFHFLQAVGMLIVPLFFLFGSMTSGQLIDIPQKLKKKPRYYTAFGIIFFLLVMIYLGGIFDLFGTFGEPLNMTRDYTLLILLCFTCGIQNGTVTTVSNSVIRTTHLTGLTTDLGIGLSRLFNRSLLGKTYNETAANWMRIGIILCFGLGSVVGAFAFGQWKYHGFLVPVCTSGLLFGAMTYFQFLRPSVKP